MNLLTLTACRVGQRSRAVIPTGRGTLDHKGGESRTFNRTIVQNCPLQRGHLLSDNSVDLPASPVPHEKKPQLQDDHQCVPTFVTFKGSKMCQINKVKCFASRLCVLNPELCVKPLHRSGPDPSQHVPDCRDQPGSGQPARPGCHGTRRYTHRQHRHVGRPSSRGCDPRAVTFVAPEAACPAWPLWTSCFRGHHAVYGVEDIFKCKSAEAVKWIIIVFTM